MSEVRALTVAGIGHLALFAAMSVGWSLMSDPDHAFEEPISVELVNVADMPTVTERPDPSLEAAPRETIDTAELEEIVPLEDTPPPELVRPDPVAELPEPEPVPEVKPDPLKPKPKPKPKQELTAPVDRAKAEAPKAREEQDFAKLITDALPTRATLSSLQQATLAQAIQSRLYKCWDPNAGGPDSDKIVTTLRVKAAKSGEIVGRPELVRQTGDAAAGYKRAARDAAIRAVMNPACSLKGLPADLYAGGWEDFTVNFDPKDF